MVLFTISFLLGFQDRPRNLSFATYHSTGLRKSKAFKGSMFNRKSTYKRSKSSFAKRRGPSALLSTTHQGITYMHPDVKRMKTCHIFYLLSPTQMVNISVAMMGEVAKVCTKDDVVALKTIKTDKYTRWVAFSITHRLKDPEDFADITKWNQHKIEFTLSENPLDLFPRIHKPDVYFARNRTDSSVSLGEVHFEEMNIVVQQRAEEEEEIAESAAEQKSSKRSEMPNKTLTLNSNKLQAVPSPSHVMSVKQKIIDSVTIPSMLQVRQPTEASLGGFGEEIGEERTKGKRRKMKKKGKSKNSGELANRLKTILATIAGTKILYDKRTWTNGKLHVSKNVHLAHLWFTSTNIMNQEMRNQLIPFGIHIKNLMNFPEMDVPSLPEIKLRLSLGDLIKNVTIACPKTETESPDRIEIDEVKMFFLGEVPLLKIIENLQMRKLVIEIYGPKVEEIQEKPLCSWDELNMIATRLITKPPRVEVQQKVKSNTKSKANNKKKKKKKKNKRKEHSPSKSGGATRSNADREVFDLSQHKLLGYAEVNCSALAADGFIIDNDVNIRQYNSQERIQTVSHLLQHFDLYSAHEDINREHKGTLQNGEFVKNKTFLQVSLRISGLPTVTSIERSELYRDLYKRILVIFYKKTIITPIVKQILKVNASILNHKYLEIPWVPFWFARKFHPEDDGEFFTQEHPCILSGFAIEFADLSIMMVEGLNDYTFPEAMKSVFFLPTGYGRVLYNEQLIFTERLYHEFIPIGGLFISTSKIGLNEIINNRKTFLRGNIPIPALRALHDFYQLLHCRTMQLASMENIFPKTQDLLSFGVEFGSPSNGSRSI